MHSIFDPLPGWIIDKYDQIMATGAPSLECLRQFTHNQALAAPPAEVHEKLEAANKQINEYIENQEKDSILIAQQQDL